ncbi:MAG TPA: hypothetical protein VKU01_25390 [Bryobacteraceae bacterium]|nr:hypothetical protein [Bryobacteraceae bacterium]
MPLPTRIPESIALASGYISAMLQAWDGMKAVGNITMRGFLIKLAGKSPGAYQWVVRIFPTLVRGMSSVFVSGASGVSGTSF